MLCKEYHQCGVQVKYSKLKIRRIAIEIYAQLRTYCKMKGVSTKYQPKNQMVTGNVSFYTI